MDQREREKIREHGIRVYTMREVDMLGMQRVMEEAIELDASCRPALDGSGSLIALGNYHGRDSRCNEGDLLVGFRTSESRQIGPLWASFRDSEL